MNIKNILYSVLRDKSSKTLRIDIDLNDLETATSKEFTKLLNEIRFNLAKGVLKEK